MSWKDEMLQKCYKNIKNVLIARGILKNYSLNDILKIRDFIIGYGRKKMNEKELKENIKKVEELFEELENVEDKYRYRLFKRIQNIFEENPEILYKAPNLVEKYIVSNKEYFREDSRSFYRINTKSIEISEATPDELIHLIYDNPEYFSEETIDSLLKIVFGGRSELYIYIDDEKEKEVSAHFLNDKRILRRALSKDGSFYWNSKTIYEYVCDNFETIFKNFDPYTKAAVTGLRENLLQGIVDQRIIINKDGNFQAKNGTESLDIETAKHSYYYELDEEFLQKIIKKVYKLETFADVKKFYGDIDTILKKDMQTEGTVINSLCNCKSLGSISGNFREVDERYGPNTKFEYLKSLAYSAIKNRLKEIKRDREKATGNNKKKAAIDKMFEGWGENGEQK